MTLRRLLRDAGLNFSDLSRLLVVGGASRMPMVSAMLEQETGLPLDRLPSVEDAVAHGAALYGQSLMRKWDAGTQVAGTTASDSRSDIHLRNVSSHTLGLLGKDKTTGKHRRQLLIARNSPLPTKKTQRFTTFQDNQPSVVVAVIEGGDDNGQGAVSIGRCVVSDLPPDIPKGTAIDITFDYLDNGRLHVLATIPSMSQSATVAIERASGMSDATLRAWSDCLASGLPDTQRLPVDLVPPPAAIKPRAPAAVTATAAVAAPVAATVPVAMPIVAQVVAAPIAAASVAVVADFAPPLPAAAEAEDDDPLAALFGQPTAAVAAVAVAPVPVPKAVPAAATKAAPAAKKPAAKPPAAVPAAPVAAPAVEEDAPWMSGGAAPAHGDDGVDFESLFGNG